MLGPEVFTNLSVCYSTVGSLVYEYARESACVHTVEPRGLLCPDPGTFSTGHICHVKVAESWCGFNASSVLFPHPCIFKVGTNKVLFPVFFFDSLFYTFFIEVVYIE